MNEDLVEDETGGIQSKSCIDVDNLPPHQAYFYQHFPEIESEAFRIKGCTRLS